MANFTVNGVSVSPSKKQKLLRFLRDELHITSVKDGCSQGACGACTVIIDGETVKACVPDTDSLAGKQVVTVEGLTPWEQEVYTFAYAEAGAVQCGFCIPGMVMCTKALLDKNPAPTEEEIRYALRNNYCRCTGYVKIIAAVRLAAQIMHWAAGFSAWMPGKRFWEPGNIRMIIIWKECSSAGWCAASMPGPECCPSTRQRPWPFPKWLLSIRHPTFRGKISLGI